jgi:hypothetical protein
LGGGAETDSVPPDRRDCPAERETLMTMTLPKGFTREGILAVLAVLDGDGHTIFKPEQFDGLLPAPFLKRYITTHKSDRRSPKSTIFVNGWPVKSLRGVYGLSLYHGLARTLGVQFAEAMGRGREARNIHAAMMAALGGK